MIRQSKLYPFKHKDDPQLEEISFCLDVKHGLYEHTHMETLQARMREIVYRYGWNVAKYPPAVARTFWDLATGDWFGEFRRKLAHIPDDARLDASDKSIVEYHC